MLRPIFKPIFSSVLKPVIDANYPAGAIVWMINGKNLLINGKQVISYKVENND